MLAWYIFPSMRIFSELRPAEQLRGGLFVFLLGIFFPFELGFSLLAFIGILLLVAAGIFRNMLLVLASIFLLAMSWVSFRSEFDFRNDELIHQQGNTVDINGVVRTSPDVRENSVRAFVTTEKGNFLLILPSMQLVQYGDEIFIRGKITIPRDFGDFQYRRYLRRWGAQTIIKNPERVEIISSGQGNGFVRVAQAFRTFLESNVRRALPEPHATIAVGVLLGVKSSLPEWTQDDFKNSGLQHLLVVSGSNVAIVVSLVSLLLARFGRPAVFVGSLIALGFFVLLVGPDAPVLRAAVMGGVVGIAAALGRFSDARTLILLSASIIGFIQPTIVRDDVGFHLSFVATMGIVLGTPILLHYFSKVSDAKWWKPLALILAVSLAAQVAVLPILGRSFGTFPIAGVFANIFAEPLVPIAMGAGSVTAAFGWFPIFFARIFAIPAFVSIEVLLWVAHIFGQIPILPLAPWITWSSGIILGIFASWGLLSRSFAEHWLVREVLDEKMKK
jgi:competence protein ComEC